jgi:hypothetical protein
MQKPDRLSMLLGYLAGRYAAALRQGPKAYVFNGTQLPPFPGYDREQYPYACISRVADWGQWFFSGCTYVYWVCSQEPVWYAHPSDNGAMTLSAAGQVLAWGLIDGKLKAVNRTGTEYIHREAMAHTLHWCQRTVFDAQGGVFLEGTRPTPVWDAGGASA